jgi:hypothetical protein
MSGCARDAPGCIYAPTKTPHKTGLPKVLAVPLSQVRHHDGVVDDRRHTGPRVGKVDSQPDDGVAPVDRRRYATGDFDDLGCKRSV